MRYTILHRVFDDLIMILLVFSTGGLLFVFNRNDSYFFLLGILLFTLIFLGSRLKTKLLNSSLLAFFSIVVLIAINYFFAISEQSINKYGYYLMVITVSVLTIIHFLNRRNVIALDFSTLYF